MSDHTWIQRSSFGDSWWECACGAMSSTEIHPDEGGTIARAGTGQHPRPKWEGVVYVCNTCDRKAEWPFCKHKTDDGRWYRVITVREVR